MPSHEQSTAAAGLYEGHGYHLRREVGVEELGAVEGTGEATGVNERAGGFFSALMTSGVSNHAC